ncbi:MAG: hypothetical protein DLM66_00155 [Candidatus Dormiibacter spiritus]|nr:MAG: hypothetical protein DLM66_00155 [Candidatus Dormibacteraeota bacterium]
MAVKAKDFGYEGEQPELKDYNGHYAVYHQESGAVLRLTKDRDFALTGVSGVFGAELKRVKDGELVAEDSGGE